MRRQNELLTAGLTGKTEVKRGQVLRLRGVLDVLKLIDIIVGEVLLKWASDVVRLLLILLDDFDIHITLSGHQHRV